ncbi:hypothetical protein Tco_1226997 [Tanacetum coccineum]
MSTLVNTSSTEISVLKQKHDELLKKSLLTRSQFEGQLKEKNKVVSDLKVKEGRDIDKMIEMEKQIKFLNEILYKRNQSIQTIHIRECLETKTPRIVPISASKPREKRTNLLQHPIRKQLHQIPLLEIQAFTIELYENTNQEWKWWIAKRCPSVYTWTQKPLRTKKIWMPKIRKDDESTSISPTIDIVSRITNVLKISNSLGSNLSNVPSSSNSLADCTTHPIHYVQLGRQCQMVSAENNTSGPAPFLNVQMTSVHISSGLVLHQMTSDHNRSELGIQDHSNEPSSSKLVPKVVPLAVKTATSRQELELHYHHHISNMASSSCSTPIRINFHHGGVFEANPINYEFDMVSKLDNVDIYAMDYSAFVTYLETISHALSNALYFVVPGLDLKNGLRSLKNDFGMRNLREYALKNDGEIDVYMAHSNSDEDDTASLDHISDGEDEIVGVRTQKPEPKNKKIIPVMFDDTFLATIFKGLDKDKYVEKNVVLNDEMNPEDEDRLGELWPIHDPKTKWKLMRPVLGETFEGPDQLKRCLAYFALSNGYKLYYEVNDGKRLLTRCSRNADGKPECTYRMWASWMQKERSFEVKSLVDEHCCSRTYEFGGKIKALEQYKTCLEDHYVCKGQLLSAVGRDGNNQVYPIAWAVVDVENKENWMWFMQCLIDDLGIAYGEGLTIISDQHKGIVEAAKEVMPMAEHRQCARHIYANFRKRFTGVLYRNLLWEAAKCTVPKKFEEVMQQIKSISGDAYKHSMDRNPQSWSRAFFTTDRACDAVENGISECFNSLIVDARRKPIINMLEDIRTFIMKRMKKMRDKHLEWKDEIGLNIRKFFEIIKDKRWRDSRFSKVNCGHQRHITFIVSMKWAGTKSPASRLMIYETRQLKEIGRTRTQETSHKDIGAFKNITTVNLAKVSMGRKKETGLDLANTKDSKLWGMREKLIDRHLIEVIAAGLDETEQAVEKAKEESETKEPEGE